MTPDPAQPIPRPPHLRVEEGVQGRVLVRRWRKGPWEMAGGVLFCLVWNSFLVVWYALAFHDPNTPLMAKLFPLLHVAIGVGMTYHLAALFLNRTELVLAGGGLRVRHGPLPWRGRRDISIDQVRQVQVVDVSRTDGYGNRLCRYDVRFLDPQAAEHSLLRRLPTAAEALFIKNTLDTWLRISDPHA